MTDFKQIKHIEGLYKSKNVYFIDVLIERGGMEFRIRYPYQLQNKAKLAMNAMKAGQPIPKPDDRPSIWLVGAAKQRY